MKKIIVVSMLMMTTMGFSMDADQLKDAALKACETQVANVPEDMRAKTKKVCECNVNNTDYAAILAAQQSGDTEKVQQDALKVAQECAKEAM